MKKPSKLTYSYIESVLNSIESDYRPLIVEKWLTFMKKYLIHSFVNETKKIQRDINSFYPFKPKYNFWSIISNNLRWIILILKDRFKGFNGNGKAFFLSKYSF